MKKNITILALMLSVQIVYSANPGQNRAEQDTLKVSVAHNFAAGASTEVKKIIQGAQIDPKYVTDALKKEIDDYIAKQGSGKLVELKNFLLKESLKKAEAASVTALKAYNGKVAAIANGVSKQVDDKIKEFSPVMAMKGTYKYCHGERSPGIPGWSHNHTTIEGFKNVGGSLNIDLTVPLDISVNIDPEVFGTKLAELGFTSKINLGIIGGGNFAAVIERVGSAVIATPNLPTSLAARDLKIVLSGSASITSHQGFTKLDGVANLQGNKLIDEVTGKWTARPLVIK